ncbi:MAG: phosphoribosyltransferase [Planktothrix sp.]|uniref:phosphoribosyltransferase n=1 Tax=Planktothrix sp. TaxID=3088171 RepID=UPI0038D42403
MLSKPLFRDRTHAGEELAKEILLQMSWDGFQADQKMVVYGLPRGGVPVAVPIAQRLKSPLSVIVAKKITLPENPELALGAVTSDGQVLWSKRKPQNFNLQQMMLQQAQTKAQQAWEQFAPSCPPVTAYGALALVVDDGIATGMTMAVASQALKLHQPLAIWICVPVAPMELISSIQQWCDRLIVLETPYPFFNVSRFYEQFDQVETQTVLSYLQQQTWLQ